MRLSEYASTRKTRGSYKMPRSVQQSIPIDRIYADGVWQSGNVFSMMWQISDINYAMQSDAAKQNILTQLGTVYAGIPADCWMQVCIVSQRMDEKAFARDVLYHRENDGFDALRAERNRQIKANARENGNVVQHKYIIVSTNKPGVKEARERFVQVQGHLLSAFPRWSVLSRRWTTAHGWRYCTNSSAFPRRDDSTLILTTAPRLGRTSAILSRQTASAFAKSTLKSRIFMPSA